MTDAEGVVFRRTLYLIGGLPLLLIAAFDAAPELGLVLLVSIAFAFMVSRCRSVPVDTLLRLQPREERSLLVTRHAYA